MWTALGLLCFVVYVVASATPSGRRFLGWVILMAFAVFIVLLLS